MPFDALPDYASDSLFLDEWTFQVTDEVSLDYEVFSEVDITDVGVDAYARHPSTEVLMCAYRFKSDGVLCFWTKHDGPFPLRLRAALSDPCVIKRAFNAAFERMITQHVLRIPTPIRNWRCTMVLAYSQSFTGGLDQVGEQLRLDQKYAKNREGKALIRMFCQPQKTTKNQPHVRRTRETDPDAWQRFCNYCQQDVIAEEAQFKRLSAYPMLLSEWELYEIDQEINDQGLPVNIAFITHADRMSQRRTKELNLALLRLLDPDVNPEDSKVNPNSTAQLLPWLQERGYWFNDLRAETVVKVLAESADPGNVLRTITPECRAALLIRQWSARTSIDKYAKLLMWADPTGWARHMFQFGGASRTNRWAGRGPQPQNLPRTPKSLEDLEAMQIIADIIAEGDYEALELWCDEPLEMLVGSARSSFQAPPGYVFDVCDLSAIESRVIGWLCGCIRLNKVFADGRDPYKDFGQDMYNCTYVQVTKKQRSNSKPAVLGAGYRLGGGRLENGKRTGLWGYAESMGVDITQEEANRMVMLFREKYPEIPQMWYALEAAVVHVIRTGEPRKTGPVTWSLESPYLIALLPSGRKMYYQYPEVEPFEMLSRRGNKYIKWQISYMAKSQTTHQWIRQESHGGLLIENLVQAIARDVLKEGLLRAWHAGYKIVGHVHDEIITLRKIGENMRSVEGLRYLMKKTIDWAPGLLLDAAGWSGRIYHKD